MSEAKHNSSPKSAVSQPNVGSLKQSPMGTNDVLIYPKPDGSAPVAKGFDLENSPSGTGG